MSIVVVSLPPIPYTYPTVGTCTSFANNPDVTSVNKGPPQELKDSALSRTAKAFTFLTAFDISSAGKGL